MTLATAPRENSPIQFRTPRGHEAPAVQTAIEEAFRRTGYGELGRLEVHCDGDVVIISGRVPTYYLKQLAQNIAANVPESGRICNELRVCG